MLGPHFSVYWYQYSDHIPQFIGINAWATYLSLLVLLLKPHISLYWYHYSNQISEFIGIIARTTSLSLLVSMLGPHISVFLYRSQYQVLEQTKSDPVISSLFKTYEQRPRGLHAFRSYSFVSVQVNCRN